MLCITGLVTVGEECSPGGLGEGHKIRRLHTLVARQRLNEPSISFVVTVQRVREPPEVVSDAPRHRYVCGRNLSVPRQQTFVENRHCRPVPAARRRIRPVHVSRQPLQAVGHREVVGDLDIEELTDMIVTRVMALRQHQRGSKGRESRVVLYGLFDERDQLLADGPAFGALR